MILLFSLCVTCTSKLICALQHVFAVITCLVSGCAICYPVEVQYSVQTSSHKPSCGLPVVKGTAICNSEVWAEQRISVRSWLRAVCVAWGRRCPLILAAHKLQQGTVVTGCLNPDTVYMNTFVGCFARFYITCSCGPVTYRVPRKSLYLHLCYLCIGCSSNCSSIDSVVSPACYLPNVYKIRRKMLCFLPPKMTADGQKCYARNRVTCW
jgi:hypothetical protein